MYAYNYYILILLRTFYSDRVLLEQKNNNNTRLSLFRFVLQQTMAIMAVISQFYRREPISNS